MLVRSFYYDFSLTRRVNDNGIKIIKPMTSGIDGELYPSNGEDTLRINIVNSPVI